MPTPLTKEEIEDRIRKHIKAGHQMDYNGMDELEPVFNTEEVLENIMIELDKYSNQQSIAFADFAEKHFSFSYGTYNAIRNSSFFIDQDTEYTTEELYNLFIEHQSKQQQ